MICYRKIGLFTEIQLCHYQLMQIKCLCCIDKRGKVVTDFLESFKYNGYGES